MNETCILNDIGFKTFKRKIKKKKGNEIHRIIKKKKKIMNEN